MSAGLDKALEVEKRAQRRFNIAKNMFFVYLVIVTLFTSIQTIMISQQIKDNLDASRATAADNHKKTQDYVKCVALTLLKPLAQRQGTDFENCTVTEDKKSSKVDDTDNSVSQSPPSNNAIGVTPHQSGLRETNTPEETTGAAPPDPKENTDNPTPARKNSRVLTIIDGVLKEVDDSRLGGLVGELGL